MLYPERTLVTGYAMVRKQGKVVRSVKDLTAGDEVEIRLADGTARAGIL